jgi:hypothetical protein
VSRVESRVGGVEKTMNRKIIGLALGAMLFALCPSAEAQLPKKVPRIASTYSGKGYIVGSQLFIASLAISVR